MRSSLPYYGFGFILLVVLLVVIGPRLVQGPVSGLVNEIIGQGEIKPGGSSAWRSLELGELVKEGDSLRTEEGAEVNIRWSEGTHLRMGEQSEIIIGTTNVNNVSRKSNLQIKQIAGTLWARLLKEPKLTTKLEVTSNDITYKAGHSTTFSNAFLSGEQNRLEVFEGHCEVIQGQDRSIVDAPQVAVYDKSGIIEPARSMTGEEIDVWQANTQITGAFITLLAPQAGEKIASSLLSLSGYTDPGNVIQISASNQGAINETRAEVNKIGEWYGKIALSKGDTELRITVLDGEGRQSVIVRKVSY